MFDLGDCEVALVVILGVMVVLYLFHRFVLSKGNRHHENRSRSDRF